MPRKLKATDLRSYKERLLAIRSRLRGDVSAMADSALKASGGGENKIPLHMADIGSENFQQEFTLGLMENEEEMLDKIEVALERIESKEYGLCQACTGLIPKTRLNALPHTTHCVSCAEMIQKR